MPRKKKGVKKTPKFDPTKVNLRGNYISGGLTNPQNTMSFGASKTPGSPGISLELLWLGWLLLTVTIVAGRFSGVNPREDGNGSVTTTISSFLSRKQACPSQVISTGIFSRATYSPISGQSTRQTAAPRLLCIA